MHLIWRCKNDENDNNSERNGLLNMLLFQQERKKYFEKRKHIWNKVSPEFAQILPEFGSLTKFSGTVSYAYAMYYTTGQN